MSPVRFLLVALAFLTVSTAKSQSIVEKIICDSIIIVQQPDELAKRLVGTLPLVEPVNETEPAEDVENVSTANPVLQRVAGFRVQVFSDNNTGTAKTEARTKSRAVGDAFPQYRTYVTYEAPFWRLRVGDFRSRIDAESAADEIKRQFPSYSREVRVVRDRINVVK